MLTNQPFDGENPNTQEIEARSKSAMPDVHSVFFTLQGEGPFSGQRALFIRFAGCNLQCPMCDTEYTKQRTIMPVDTLAQVASDYMPHGGLVVITGGEPFRQPNAVTNLTFALMDAGHRVQIETNGALPVPEDIREFCRLQPADSGVFVVCSPKMNINQSVLDRAMAFKYVLSEGAIDAADGLPSSVLGLPAAPARPRKDRHGNFTTPVYIQPADEQDAKRNFANNEAVVAVALSKGYIAQVQAHKILNVE